MESLLSLSDVELGMEEHAGDTEDVDYHKRKIKRRVSVVLEKIIIILLCHHHNLISVYTFVCTI